MFIKFDDTLINKLRIKRMGEMQINNMPVIRLIELDPPHNDIFHEWFFSSVQERNEKFAELEKKLLGETECFHEFTAQNINSQDQTYDAVCRKCGFKG